MVVDAQRIQHIARLVSKTDGASGTLASRLTSVLPQGYLPCSLSSLLCSVLHSTHSSVVRYIVRLPSHLFYCCAVLTCVMAV